MMIWENWPYWKRGIILGLLAGSLSGIAIVLFSFLSGKPCAYPFRCFSSFVIFFGVFGTLVGLIRDIIDKIKEKYQSSTILLNLYCC
jgi:hypothetical protein